MLQYAVYTPASHQLIADYSSRALGVTFSTNVHGGAECTCFVPMALQEAFALYDVAEVPNVRITDSATGTLFTGRLEDIAITDNGVSLTALGYSRSLGDVPYTVLWSTTDIRSFRPFLASEVATATPDRYSFDTNNRIYITAQKNATLGNTGAGKQAMIGFELPSQSTRSIIGVSFDYIQGAPTANWRFFFQTRNANFTGIANPWGVTGGIGTSIGTVCVTFAAARVVNFFMDFNAADAVFAGETGSAYLIITNLRLVTTTDNMVNTTTTAVIAAGSNVNIPVVSSARMYVGQYLSFNSAGTLGATVSAVPDPTHVTVATLTFGSAAGLAVRAHVVYADEIVDECVVRTNSINPTQLTSVTALVQSPALDLLDEVYADLYPSDILDRLIRLGDNQATPRQWEWGVDNSRSLYFRPNGSLARTWYIDIAELEVQRTIDALYNSVYAVYRQANGRTLRTAGAADLVSITRYGLQRQQAIPVQTTSLTQANAQRDAALSDTKDPTPKSGVRVTALFDANGSRWPLTSVASGDTMIIRNLSPTLSNAINRIRVFRVTRTEYAVDTDTLTLEPESPLPSLAAMLALAVPPSWVTSPWWVQVGG